MVVLGRMVEKCSLMSDFVLQGIFFYCCVLSFSSGCLDSIGGLEKVFKRQRMLQVPV